VVESGWKQPTGKTKTLTKKSVNATTRNDGASSGSGVSGSR